ncbi:hypothetical protein SAY86_019596 [Trapa natans]|uniref:RING-type E3 ubiquitin transferase n=1 Tax=Trapa natans TaxID=22666 RepID=A0AAN7LKT5_TRANT|nr:hypothetical protein SAY86_019596 [Trapa natans]
MESNMMDFNIGVEDVGFAVLQELWNRVAMQAKELSNEARDVVVEKNSFQQFSRSISQLNTLLNSLDIKKLGATNGLQLTKNALEMLNSQLQRAGKIVQDCKSSSSLRVLLQSSSILGQMQDISKEIAVTISSFQLSNFGISSNLKGMSHEIIHRLGSAEFRSSTATEMIASGIERSMVHNRKDHESTVKLLEGIAQAVGSTSGRNTTSIREGLAILKQEKDMEVQKKQAEALQLSQLIHLLHITETAVADQPSNTNPVPDITTLRANSVDPFMCPLSKKMMRDPVAILCGHSFERKAIEEHFEAGNRTCPTCKEKLESVHITPNLSLRGSLEEWRRRDMDLRFQNGIRALISDDCTLQNSALEDLQSLLETPSYMSRVVEENLIPKFVSFLKDERLSTVATLRCLNCLARHSEDSKVTKLISYFFCPMRNSVAMIREYFLCR